MSEEKFTVYVTKYALTKGIFAAEVRRGQAEDLVMTTGEWPLYLHRGEWFVSEDKAKKNAIERCKRKLKSISKQKSKIEKMIAEWSS